MQEELEIRFKLNRSYIQNECDINNYSKQTFSRQKYEQECVLWTFQEKRRKKTLSWTQASKRWHEIYCAMTNRIWKTRTKSSHNSKLTHNLRQEVGNYNILERLKLFKTKVTRAIFPVLNSSLHIYKYPPQCKMLLTGQYSEDNERQFLSHIDY